MRGFSIDVLLAENTAPGETMQVSVYSIDACVICFFRSGEGLLLQWLPCHAIAPMTAGLRAGGIILVQRNKDFCSDVSLAQEAIQLGEPGKRSNTEGFARTTRQAKEPWACGDATVRSSPHFYTSVDCAIFAHEQISMPHVGKQDEVQLIAFSRSEPPFRLRPIPAGWSEVAKDRFVGCDPTRYALSSV
jgi:hypothetical protein